MEFRKTTEAALTRVAEIFDGARETMHAQGIDQWTDGYPAVSDIRADIADGISYVLCTDDGGIVATCAVLLSGEDTYTDICGGAWLTESSDDADASYVAVHRVAVQPTADIAKSRDNTDLSFKSICFIDARRSSAADPVKWLEMSEKNGSSLKMVFGDTTYTVSGVDTLYDDTGMLHHWEVLLT